MRKVFYYIQLIIIFSLVVIILFENISLPMCVFAILLSSVSIWVSEKVFLRNSYYELYYFNVFLLLYYFCILLIEIYKSSIAIIPTIFSGRAHPTVIAINCDLEEPLYTAIVANSITLTPGTITVDVSGHRLLVLWLTPKTKESTMAGKIIKGRFESIIKRWLP